MRGELYLTIVILFGVLGYGLIVSKFLKNWLATSPTKHVLQILIALHFFRYVGLTFILPEAAAGKMPIVFSYPAAIGDFIAAMLAIVAFLALQKQLRMAIPLVWLFNIVGSLDLAYAFSAAIASGAANLAGGAVWWIPSVYVPALLVSHFIIFQRLIKGHQSQLGLV